MGGVSVTAVGIVENRGGLDVAVTDGTADTLVVVVAVKLGERVVVELVVVVAGVVVVVIVVAVVVVVAVGVTVGVAVSVDVCVAVAFSPELVLPLEVETGGDAVDAM